MAETVNQQPSVADETDKEKLDKERVDALYQAIQNIDDVTNGINKAEHELEIGKVSPATIISVIVSIIVAFNTLSLIFGWNKSLDENFAYQWGSAIALVINLAWTIWKNHDFTKLARARTALVDKLTK